MKINTQRSLDRFVGTFLCRLLSLFPWRYKQVPSGFQPRKILVIILSEMGSLVLARPMFETLRARYPKASLHLLVFERNKGVLDVLELAPAGCVLTVNDRSLGAFLRSSVLALLRLRRIRIDTVLDCELFSRISALFSLWSGAEVRAGFHRHTQEGLFRGDFINRPVLYNPYFHISEQFIHLVQSLGVQGNPLVKQNASLTTSSASLPMLNREEIHEFTERLRKDFPYLQERELILLYPGGGLLPIRAWPLTYYGEVAKDLIGNGYAVGVVGMAEDRKLAGEIGSSCPGLSYLDFTGYTRTVKELVLLLYRASLLITNDGGPGHFASLASIPSIVLYGPETPTLYGVRGHRSSFFYHPLPCSPCLTAYNHRRSPCDGNNACLKGISPQAVLQKARELLTS